MQTSQKQYADRQRRDHSVVVKDQVLLDTRNLNLSHLPSKLRPRFCGPFLVEAQVTPVTFRLCLPDTWKLHNAFHVQLLKPYKDPNRQFQGWQLPPPPPVLVQDEPEYEVERVLTHRRRGGKTLEFLIRWNSILDPHSLPLQPPLLCRPSRVLPCLALRAALLAARRPALPAMASLSVLTFDHKGRPIQFNTWLDDLQLYLLSDSRDSVSLFDHTSGASLAHPATADSATRSQWLTRDAAARLAFRNHLPLAERARFGQQKTAKALYDALVARY
ncbi:unnamed protein product [Closterium sp. NIES-53]